MCSTAWVSLEPVEYPWTRWGGEPEGLHIKHGDIPVTVKVTWTDGTEGEVNAWTSQWTHTHVASIVGRLTAHLSCSTGTSGRSVIELAPA